MPLSNTILLSQGVSWWLASPNHKNLCPFSLHKLQATFGHTNLTAPQPRVHVQCAGQNRGWERPDTAGPLQRLLWESPLVPVHYLQYMMDEWCSPYSSWLRTMKGCSCRTPTASAPLVGILVEVSTCSACSSEHGSVSAVLISVFFSALWPWRKKSWVKYKEAAAPDQVLQPLQPAGRKKNKMLHQNSSIVSSTLLLPGEYPFWAQG